MAKRKKLRVFEQLKESLESALAHERGEAGNLRVTDIPSPPKRVRPSEIKEIRNSLNLSQALFAYLLNVSLKAVQSWEQGNRRPQSAALKLLTLAKKNPEVLLRA